MLLVDSALMLFELRNMGITEDGEALRPQFDAALDCLDAGSNGLLRQAVDQVEVHAGDARETIACLSELGAEVVAAACIIDRSAGKTDVGVPLIALAEYEVPAYPADKLPPELAAIPAIKPGSRNI